MMAKTAVAIAGATAVAFLVACSSPRQDSADQASRPAGPSKAVASRKVALPDLTGMAPSVQQQLRDQASELARLDADNASPGPRAEAYGEMGKLLLAVESLSDAEASLLNNGDDLAGLARRDSVGLDDRKSTFHGFLGEFLL